MPLRRLSQSIITCLYVWVLIPTIGVAASSVSTDLVELKSMVFDAPEQAIVRAEHMSESIGGSKAGQAWLEIKALQVLAMTKLEKFDDARRIAAEALQSGAWIENRHHKFSLQLTEVDAGSSLGATPWDKLSAKFDALIEAIEATGDDQILARALTSYAAAAAASRRPLLGAGMMQKVLALLPRLEKDEFYYSILNDLVVTQQNLREGGDLETVLALAEEVRNFLKDHKRRFLGFEMLYNLAIAYASSEQLTKAQETMQEGLTFAEALGDPNVTAFGKLGMGFVLNQAEQYAQAEKLTREALSAFEKIGNPFRVQESTQLLLDLLLHQSQVDEAEKLLAKIEAMQKDSTDLPKVDMDDFKARIHSSRGRYEQATQTIYESWKHWRDFIAKEDSDRTQRMLMEFEASRQEMERLNLQERERIQQLQLEQNQKQEQLKIWMLISLVIICLSCVFDFVRVKRKTTEILTMHRRMRGQVLGRFLAPELAQAVANGQANFDEKPREATVTLLFVSIDGFKPGIGSLPLAQEVELLNEMTELMSQAIFAQGGTLDKCYGGRVSGLFGAPISLDAAESARRAIQCLQSLHKAFREANHKWQPKLQRPLTLRASLHQGKVIVGSFGCARRIDFTALGLAWQVAEAMEVGALSGQCLLSETVIPFAKAESIRELGFQQIKGLNRPMRVAELILEGTRVQKNLAS